jgi:hypothetical protein
LGKIKQARHLDGGPTLKNERLVEKRLILVAVFLLASSSLAITGDACNCKGYSGPGGPCYAGPGGPAYKGPGGAAYTGPGGPCYAGPGGRAYNGPGGPEYSGPGGRKYSGPVSSAVGN